MRRMIVFAGLLATLPAQAWAWGQEGHSIVAEIADRRLSENASAEVDKLLGAGVSLASVASWADDIYHASRPETKNWHFVDIPGTSSEYDSTRDCKPDTTNGDCVIAEIGRAKADLGDKTKSPIARREALMFLVHFVGDLHQPLHNIEDEAGGNGINVEFFGQKQNLHALWDGGIIHKRVFDWGEYVRILEKDWLTGKDETMLAQGDPIVWSNHAHELAVSVAFDLPADHKLSGTYYDKARPVVDEQLALAGIRLARLINEALK